MGPLSPELRSQLYLIVWQGVKVKATWLKEKAVQDLIERKLVKRTPAGVVATAEGHSALSPSAQAACKRPQDYFALSGEDQWAVDRNLGILDWDGS